MGGQAAEAATTRLKVCTECGATFRCYRSQVAIRKTCGPSCAQSRFDRLRREAEERAVTAQQRKRQAYNAVRREQRRIDRETAKARAAANAPPPLLRFAVSPTPEPPPIDDGPPLPAFRPKTPLGMEWVVLKVYELPDRANIAQMAARIAKARGLCSPADPRCELIGESDSCVAWTAPNGTNYRVEFADQRQAVNIFVLRPETRDIRVGRVEETSNNGRWVNRKAEGRY